MARIGIIGGGVVGLSCAVRLQQSGHAVTVFEAQADRSAASWGNAGHIATEQVAPLASLASLRSVPRRLFAAGGALDLPSGMARAWLPFALRMIRASTPARFARGKVALAALLADALPAWQRLVGDLGAPALVRADGHFVLWESAASARKGAAAWLAADTGTAHATPATPDEMARLARLTTAPVAGALRFHGSGQITDLTALGEALERRLEEAGGRILRRTARLVLVNGRATFPDLECDLVLVAGGVRSGALLAGIGLTAPIIAERGYHIRAAADAWPADMPPLVFEDRSMIVTRYVDSVQAASFVEFGDADGPPDPRKWARLEHHLAALDLPVRAPFTRWMGARPTLPDYLPAIGRSARVPNLLYAFGHQHLGLTLAPITAEIVRALVDDAPPPVDLTPYDISRFDARKDTA